jgi:hypothetical protein
MSTTPRQPSLEVAPGPDFLVALETRFANALPQALVRADATLRKVQALLGLTLDEWSVLHRGILAYYLLFVETALELKGSPLTRNDEIAELQLLALLHWRSVDALLDTDSLQLSSNRHKQLAHAASELIRERAQRLGIEWTGSAGQRYRAFYAGSKGKILGASPSGTEIVEAFLEEQFIREPDGRMSFLHFTPEYVLRADASDMVWYKFYVSIISLDDDIDDLLADATARRETPVTRLLTRVGAFRPGKAAGFHRYLRFLANYLVRQIDLSIELALRDSRTAGFLTLSTIREAVSRKFEEPG